MDDIGLDGRFAPLRAYPLKLHLRSEIFAAVIRWHRLRRGGYHAARLFSLRENNVGALRRQCDANIFSLKFWAQRRNMAYLQHCYITGPIRFCSKICHVGGRILSVILWCDRPRRSLDFNSLRGAPPLHGVSFKIKFL